MVCAQAHSRFRSHLVAHGGGVRPGRADGSRAGARRRGAGLTDLRRGGGGGGGAKCQPRQPPGRAFVVVYCFGSAWGEARVDCGLSLPRVAQANNPPSLEEDNVFLSVHIYTCMYIQAHLHVCI